jgi:hypothetical protein
VFGEFVTRPALCVSAFGVCCALRCVRSETPKAGFQLAPGPCSYLWLRCRSHNTDGRGRRQKDYRREGGRNQTILLSLDFESSAVPVSPRWLSERGVKKYELHAQAQPLLSDSRPRFSTNHLDAKLIANPSSFNVVNLVPGRGNLGFHSLCIWEHVFQLGRISRYNNVEISFLQLSIHRGTVVICQEH